MFILTLAPITNWFELDSNKEMRPQERTVSMEATDKTDKTDLKDKTEAVLGAQRHLEVTVVMVVGTAVLILLEEVQVYPAVDKLALQVVEAEKAEAETPELKEVMEGTKTDV